MVGKDIDDCLYIVKEGIKGGRAFDHKLISTLEKCKELEAENKRLKDEIENWKIAHSDLLESIKRREDRDRAAVKMLRTTKEKISEINDSICEAGAILL